MDLGHRRWQQAGDSRSRPGSPRGRLVTRRAADRHRLIRQDRPDLGLAELAASCWPCAATTGRYGEWPGHRTATAGHLFGRPGHADLGHRTGTAIATLPAMTMPSAASPGHRTAAGSLPPRTTGPPGSGTPDWGDDPVLRGRPDRSSTAWSADSRRIVTASDDRAARIWDADQGTPLAGLHGHTDSDPERGLVAP